MIVEIQRLASAFHDVTLSKVKKIRIKEQEEEEELVAGKNPMMLVAPKNRKVKFKRNEIS